MNEKELREKVVNDLIAIAPEVDPAVLEHDKPLRIQVDLDSFDWLRYLVTLHDGLGVDIPETDYQKLTTLDLLVAYLHQKLSGQERA